MPRSPCLSEEEQRIRNEGAKAMRSGDYETVECCPEVTVKSGFQAATRTFQDAKL